MSRLISVLALFVAATSIALAGPTCPPGQVYDPQLQTCVAGLPEPETILLFAIGAVGMAVALFRKKK